RVLAQPEVLRDEDISTTLLNECYSLKDAACLAPILNHPEEVIVEKAIWLVSEIGRRAISLRPTILKLLRHPSEYVRYYAVSTLRSTLATLSIDELAQILQAFGRDESIWVRENGLGLLIWYRTPEYQRPHALDELAAQPSPSPYHFLAAQLQASGKVPEAL